MNEKVALVLQGGGMRGVYTAGVLDFFLEKNIEFPYVVGCSAGALNSCSYISGNHGRNKTIMMQYMQGGRFASLTNYFLHGSFFDFDYLFYGIEEEVPFNWERFNSTPVRLFCTCTSFKTGKPVYFEKGKDKEFITAVAASGSLPAMIRKPVMVQGEPYCDGGPSASVPFRKPLEDGFTKMVIICTQPRGYRKDPDPEKLAFYVWRYKEAFPKFIETYKRWNETYNKDMDEIDKLADEGKAFVLYPSRIPGVSTATRDKKAINSLYKLGRSDAENAFSALLDYLNEDF